MSADIEVRWHKCDAKTGKTTWKTVWVDADAFEAGTSRDEITTAIEAAAAKEVGGVLEDWASHDLQAAVDRVWAVKNEEKIAGKTKARTNKIKARTSRSRH